MDIPHLYRQQDGASGLLYAWFYAMHSRVDLLFSSPLSEEAMLEVVRRVYACIAETEQCGNCYNETSELARLNASAGRGEVGVSRLLYDMLSSCESFHRQTEGLFDVTTDSDGFAADTFSQVRLRPRTVSLLRQGIRINLSGFLKGYVLDRLRPIVAGAGIRDALLNMGNSSIMAMGSQPGQDGWEVTLAASGQRVTLHDSCLTTSGNDAPTRQHIVNPMTGDYVRGERSVAVVTGGGAAGEALATALFMAGPARRQRLVDRLCVRQVIPVGPQAED